MNQVTEMLRLTPGASIENAIARLSSLFDMMDAAPGFQTSEILRNQGDPDLLLVLHAWDDITDWQSFQTSDAKVAFSAGRPAALYSFVPCGMNWSTDEPGPLPQDGAFLHREVVRGAQSPATGAGVVSSHVLTYQDNEATYLGATQRFTRHDAAPTVSPALDDTVIADEVYESVHKHARARSATA